MKYDFHKKSVRLYCDIDLSSVAWETWGTFRGQFDGNGCTITGAGKTKSDEWTNNHNVGTLFSIIAGTKWTDEYGYECYPYISDLRLKDFYYKLYL